ncbi:hypothetical protein AGMMS49574_16410 [Bacteroidia bacterium]|nr:hypothetical protein AGMMS49574_16410 [Bacteroidia bacterium]
MKQFLIVLTAVIMANSGCVQAQKTENKSPKILVAYYSWGGNTRAVAQHIQSLTEADLFKDIAKLCPNSTAKKGIAVDGNSVRRAKQDVKKWLQEFEIVK